MPDIFLSYNREDQDIARRFRDALVTQGLDVWWDVDLRSGVSYDEVTEAALRDSKAVIVLWSPRSAASRWVRSEATLAQRANTLLPVMIEPCSLPIMFELVQTPDLSGWKGNIADRAWQLFAADVARKVAGIAEDSADPTPVELARGAPFQLPDKPSIAVLPFVELGAGEAQSDFADGMVEEISIALSRFTTLFVIAGASSLTYRDPDRAPAKICRELGVRYLLEGSIRKAGNRVRVTVKLVDGIAGEQIWSDRFDDVIEDIFELQDRVAAAVAAKIDSSIDTAEVKRATRPVGTPGAYELYWRANALFRRMDEQSLTGAIALCDEVIQLDAENGWAISLAGFCHAARFANGMSKDPAADRAAALDYVSQALLCGGEDARVLGYCGATLSMAGGDPALATRLTERTLEMTPNSATSLFWGGWNDILACRPERGLERLESALRLNPMSMVRPMTLSAMGICLFQLERFKEAADVLTETVHQVPHFPPARAALTAALAHAGRMEEARESAVQLAALNDSWGVLAMIRDESQIGRLRDGIEKARAAQLNPA
jgi:TolB-like protein